MSARKTYKLIDTDDALKKAVSSIEKSPWIAFDLEADSLHSYPERVCLIQIGCASGQFLIDTITLDQIDLFLEAIQNRELIIHGCDYDLKLLAKQFDFTPSQIFDTKEAARLIGMRKFGLSALTSEFMGVELEKSGQKANWSQRPLKDSLMEYAKNDVIYLKDLRDTLAQKLEELGRSSWHSQTCDRLIRIFSRVDLPDPDQVWRIKGSQKLNRLGLAVLKEIWEWREEEAMRLNRPPFFVLPHKKVIDLADKAANRENFQSFIPKKFPVKRRSALIASIQEGLKSPVSVRPKRFQSTRKRGHTIPKNKVHTFEELKTHRDYLAKDLDMDPTVIASKSELETLASNWQGAKDFVMGWQWDLFAKLKK